jgi:uncharacterized membrane protein
MIEGLKKLKQRSLKQNIAWILLVGGAIGVFCATTLTQHTIDRLKNPDFNPECNLNPILSCVSVNNSPQAEVFFGLPNPFLGIIGFAALATVGGALLAGAKFRKWFWLSLLAGQAFSLLFVHWLIYSALYSIGALCLYCMVVWVVTIAMFWYTLIYVLNEVLKVPKKYRKYVDFANKHHGDILLAWYLIIIALILNRFWYYWSTLV